MKAVPVMTVTIYHNPNCSNSRKALDIIRSHGIEPHIVEYLKTPLTPQKLRHLIKETLHVPVRSVMRTQEPAYDEMGLNDADDDTLFCAMAAHPYRRTVDPTRQPDVAAGNGEVLRRWWSHIPASCHPPRS